MHGPQSKQINKAALLKSPVQEKPPSSRPAQGLANGTRAGFQPLLAHPSQPRACDQGTSCTTVDRGLDLEFSFPRKGFAVLPMYSGYGKMEGVRLAKERTLQRHMPSADHGHRTGKGS